MIPHSGGEPALSGLNALLTTAFHNSPAHILVEDDRGPVTVAEIVQRAAQLVAHLKLGNLQHGERVLIVAGAQAEALVAIVAVLRAGLEPVVAGCGVNPLELATAAQVCNAVALIGPSHYGPQDLGDLYLSAAALADTVRGILTQGPELVDGAVDVSFAALDALPMRDEADAPEREMPTIVTLAGPRLAPRLVTHRQAALFADALALVERAGINPTRRLVSLLPPASLAGLVAGPFAAFIGASRLVLHGPFAAKRFLAHCDDAGSESESGFHLVAPAEIGRIFEHEALAADLASLILVSRYEDRVSFMPPPTVACHMPVVDLYTIGEGRIMCQSRQDGAAVSPPQFGDGDLSDGLGARLNRARADQMIQGASAETRA